MANEYFQPNAVPAPNSPGSSATIRQEFDRISAGFDKLPTMAGNAGELVVVDGSGTKLITTGGSIADFVTKDGVFTLTNKTIPYAQNIWPGFGNVVTRNAGNLAGNVPVLSANSQLPALDASQLYNLNSTEIGIVAIENGGTGASNFNGAQANLGIDLKANINSPALTGTPTAPTPGLSDSSARIATTFFVNNLVNAIGAITPGDTLPLMAGVADAGNPSGTFVSRVDHRHPTDTSRAAVAAETAAGTSFTPVGEISATDVQAALAELDTEKAPIASPAFIGAPTTPTPAPQDASSQVANTSWVQATIAALPPAGMSPSSDLPLMAGVASAGTAAEASRGDHRHPTDTTRAPLVSPTFTGTPTAPTATVGTNTTQLATTAFVAAAVVAGGGSALPSDTLPLMSGMAEAGSSAAFSRGDHRHPTDTTRAPLVSPDFTGVPTAPTATLGTNTTQIATTAFVLANAGSGGGALPSDTNPLMSGVAAPGVSVAFSRGDHVHPSDTTRAPIASPTFTGVPAAPTAAGGTSTTQIATTAFVTNAVGAVPAPPSPSDTAPLMANVAVAGTSVAFSRGDHVHPTDTTRAPLVSPDFTGVPTAPTATAGNSSGQLATTAFVGAAIAAAGSSVSPSDTAPLMAGTAAAGTSAAYSRGDHRHPVDTSRAALASPTFTGVPAAPTAAAGTNTTQLATTAFVATAVAAVSGGASPSDVAPLMAGTAASGTSAEFSRGDHRHPTDTTRAPLASPTFTGSPAAPTPAQGNSSTLLATTAFVGTAIAAAGISVSPSNTTPSMNGTGAAGSSAAYSRGDHVHPTDTSRAPLVSPAFTGTPTAPTATAGTNTTQLATTAFVAGAVAGVGNPIPSGTVMLFAQAFAPAGWTRITSDLANNRMLRVVSTGNGANTAGSDSPITMTVVPSHTHTMTTGTESVSHTHTATVGNQSAQHTHGLTQSPHGHSTASAMGSTAGDGSGIMVGNGGAVDARVGINNASITISVNAATTDHNHTVTLGNASATHTHSGTTAANAGAANWAPRYVDILMCSRN